MDDSMLLELTKCFAMVSKKQDGTFLKMWYEGGAFKFHMSNNNNTKQSTFRHPSFNQHTMSTPDPRPSTLDPGLSTPDPEPICELDLREDEDEHLEEEQQEKENIDTNQENSENCAHPEKVVKSDRKILSYCNNVEGQDRTEDSFELICRCNDCYYHIGKGLRYVCVTHKGSGWHSEKPDCKRVYPIYIQHDKAGRILQYPPVN